MPGPVAAAVAAVESAGKPAGQSWAGRFALPSTGRPVQLIVPVDLTPIEALEIVGFVTTQLPKELAQARPRSRILVPQ